MSQIRDTFLAHNLRSSDISNGGQQKKENRICKTAMQVSACRLFQDTKIAYASPGGNLEKLRSQCPNYI